MPKLKNFVAALAQRVRRDLSRAPGGCAESRGSASGSALCPGRLLEWTRPKPEPAAQRDTERKLTGQSLRPLDLRKLAYTVL